MKTKLLVALALVAMFAAGNYLGYRTYDVGLSREDRLAAQHECTSLPEGCTVVPVQVLKTLLLQLMSRAPGGSNGRI